MLAYSLCFERMLQEGEGEGRRRREIYPCVAGIPPRVDMVGIDLDGAFKAPARLFKFALEKGRPVNDQPPDQP